jgi:hypothetical protein
LRHHPDGSDFIRQIDPSGGGDFPGDWMIATPPVGSGSPDYVPITSRAQLEANRNASGGKQLVVSGMVNLGGASVTLALTGTKDKPAYLRTAQFAVSHTALVSGFTNGRLILEGCNRAILGDLKLDGCKVQFNGASNTQLERYWQLNIPGDTYSPGVEIIALAPNTNCLIGFGRYDGGTGNGAPFWEESCGYETPRVVGVSNRKPSKCRGILITNIHINGLRGDVKHFASGRNPGDGCNDIGQIFQNILATGADGQGGDWSENKFSWHFRNIWIESSAPGAIQVKHRQGRIDQANNLGAGNGRGSIYEHIYFIIYPNGGRPLITIRDGYHIVRYCASFSMNSSAQPTENTAYGGGDIKLFRGKLEWDSFDHNKLQEDDQAHRLINAGSCFVHSNMMQATVGDAAGSNDDVAPTTCRVTTSSGAYRNRSVNVIAHQGAIDTRGPASGPGYGTINRRLTANDVGPGAWREWFKP